MTDFFDFSAPHTQEERVQAIIALFTDLEALLYKHRGALEDQERGKSTSILSATRSTYGWDKRNYDSFAPFARGYFIRCIRQPGFLEGITDYDTVWKGLRHGLLGLDSALKQFSAIPYEGYQKYKPLSDQLHNFYQFQRERLQRGTSFVQESDAEIAISRGETPPDFRSRVVAKAQTVLGFSPA